jgi:hypothetical protein
MRVSTLLLCNGWRGIAPYGSFRQRDGGCVKLQFLHYGLPIMAGCSNGNMGNYGCAVDNFPERDVRRVACIYDFFHCTYGYPVRHIGRVLNQLRSSLPIAYSRQKKKFVIFYDPGT